MKSQTERLTHPERSCLRSAARGEQHNPVESDDDGQETRNEHLASARRKLMASTTIEAVARAMKLGLIE